MIRSTAYALRLLRREGFLHEAGHPAEPPFWTISTDPDCGGDPSAHHVSESLARSLVRRGIVTPIGDEGVFVLTSGLSGPTASASSSAGAAASPQPSRRPAARGRRPTAAADRPR